MTNPDHTAHGSESLPPTDESAPAGSAARDALDDALFAAFSAESDESALEAIQRLHGSIGSVRLRDVAHESGKISIRTAESAAGGDSRFQVLGELARGGIGIVYRGYDRDLNRDIALKVLRPEYAANTEVVQRFIEEAQIGGQLQHPGIVPIYALSVDADGRPSFAMKLIKGQTMAELLLENPRGIDLKTVYEQVVQTMAYAHSRGVVHRDLKPANVMVGAFGEVQVVDWGFAKILGRDSVPADRPQKDRTMIATIRTNAEGSQSVAGSVMGTPAYMPPEQALGRIEELDERADVFALGAILCEILTGEPPYTGDANDRLIAAAQCRTGDALRRLEASGSAEGLQRIVRECLSALPSQRPLDASEVAAQLVAHFASVEERSRSAQVAAAQSQADAALAQRSRRNSLVLAAIVLLAVLLGGGGSLWLEREAAERRMQALPKVEAALATASDHATQSDWDEALASARQAVALAETAGLSTDRALRRLGDLQQQALEAAEDATRMAEDAALLSELEEIREFWGREIGRARGALLPVEGRMSPAAVDRSYDAAFARRFADPAARDARLAASARAHAFADNITLWAWVRRGEGGAEGWEELRALAARLDPDHAPLREAVIEGDLESLRGRAGEAEYVVPPGLAAVVGLVLVERGRQEEALAWLERHLLAAPDDYWLQLRFAQAFRGHAQIERALRHAAAAATLRPTSSTAWSEVALSPARTVDPEYALHAVEQQIALLRGEPGATSQPFRIDVESELVLLQAYVLRESLLLRTGRIEESDLFTGLSRRSGAMDAEAWWALHHAAQAQDAPRVAAAAGLRGLEAALAAGHGADRDAQNRLLDDIAGPAIPEGLRKRVLDGILRARKALGEGSAPTVADSRLAWMLSSSSEALHRSAARQIVTQLSATEDEPDATTIESLLEQARCWRELGDRTSARRLCELAFQRAPALEPIHVLRAELLDLPRELGTLQESVAKFPDSASLQTLLALELHASGARSSARRAARRASELLEEDPYSLQYRLVARALDRVGLHAEAAHLVEDRASSSIVRSQLERDFAFRVEVVGFLSRGGFRQAATDRARALTDERPGETAAWLALLRALVLDDELEEAEQRASEAVQRFPEHVDLAVLAGAVALLRDHPRTADEIAERVAAAQKAVTVSASAQRDAMQRLARHFELPARAADGERLEVDAAEWLSIAREQANWGRHREATIAWLEWFAIRERESQPIPFGVRYEAACSATRGGGEYWWSALKWLRHDLENLRARAASEPEAVREALRDWEENTALDAIRGAGGGPPGSQALWRDVAALAKEVGR